jgi:hypothetical protein
VGIDIPINKFNLQELSLRRLVRNGSVVTVGVGFVAVTVGFRTAFGLGAGTTGT